MMTPNLWSLLHTPTVELLGWTLLHFVWQGGLVAAALAGALYLLRGHSPRVRYAVSCAALFGLLALPFGTGMVLSERVLPAAPSSAPVVVEGRRALTEGGGPSMTGAADAAVPSWRVWAATWVRPGLPWMVLAWGLGVMVFALRFGGGAWRVRRLRRTSTPASSEWRERFRRLANRMGVGTPVELRQSERVNGPVLTGWWRPVVLVPVGFFSGLPPTQVETLLMHELAHVRRHDVLVGRLQAVVETLLFFHPATWWVSRRVRQAREACCDDLVVRTGADRRVYAQALATVAEQALGEATSGWAPAAGDGALLKRIRRLVAPPEAPSTAGRRLSIIAAAVLMIVVPTVLAACASQQSSTKAGPSGAKASTEGEATGLALTPQALERELAIVSVQDDSSRRVITLRGREPLEIDSLDDGRYILRYEGEGVDTLRFTSPKVSEEDMRAIANSDILDRDLRGLRLQSDSLERIILGDMSPDSLKRLIQGRFNADPLKRALRERFNLDSLGHRALRVRWEADSLARFSKDELKHWPTDSTFSFGDNRFTRDNYGPGLDVDSLLDGYERRADSLRRHFQKLRKRMEEERSERLREQARRLREQAEELEERAEEMELQRPPEEPPVPAPPTEDTSSINTSNTSVRVLDKTNRGTRYEVVSEDGRRDTMIVASSGQILAQDETSSTEPVTNSGRSAPQVERTAALSTLLHRARSGDLFEARAHALETLADSRYAQRAVVQHLFRRRALDATATDVERWKALTGLVREGGPAAVQVLRAVQADAENPELRRIAGWSLDKL